MIHSDNHVHTSFSSDSETPMEQMVQEALRRGYTSICFTDHMDYEFPDLGNGMDFILDVDAYLLEIARLRMVYPQIQIRQGIELGLKPELVKKCNALTSAHPFDFIIGSTHLVDNIDPYYPAYWEGKTEQKGIARYYEQTMENIKAGIDFDVYGHIDYIIRYTPTQQENRSQHRIQESYMEQCVKASMDVIDELLKVLISQGKGIECNTAGLKYGLGHPNPHELILKRYQELGGEILTIGSDGHQPEHFAFAFDQIAERIKACGFQYYCYFENRKPVFLPFG